MARPQKQGIDYFPVDVTFDDNMNYIIAEHGAEGFGIVIGLFQKIYREGYYTKWDNKILSLFSRKINAKKTTIEKVIETCFDENIFDRNLYEKYKILTSRGIQNRYLKICKDCKMKKISILSISTLTIALFLFAFTSNVFAQTSGKKKHSISIEKNPDKSIKRIEVRFTNEHTYDSLVFIKNALEKYDIQINYKKIEFNDNNRLKGISCEAFTKMGSGSFSESQLDSSRVGGFYCDYSKNAKSSFCIGGGCFKTKE